MITNALLTQTRTLVASGAVGISQAITCIHLCNITPETSSAQTVTVNLYVMPNGGNVSTMQYYKIYNELEITSTDTYMIDTERLILGAGDALYASCSVNNGIAMTVSSVPMPGV